MTQYCKDCEHGKKYHSLPYSRFGNCHSLYCNCEKFKNED